MRDSLARARTTEAWVFRPCIVAGEDAPLLVDQIPYVTWGATLRDKVPRAVRRLLDRTPGPVLPDPGVPFQLVHHDDVAAALAAGIAGKGMPGVYNLAAPGQCTVGRLAAELGYYTVPVPGLAVDATSAVVSRLPFMPAEASWIDTFTTPVLMDTTRATKQLGWTPQHDAQRTLHLTVEAVRESLPD